MHSWYLSDNPDESSEIMIGGWNDERVNKDEIVWHPVVMQQFWTITLDDVKVNGVSTGYCTRPTSNCTAAPDSGTSLITFPPNHFKEFDETYGQDSPCTQSQFLEGSELTFVINGVDYDVPAHHWKEREVDQDGKSGTCSSTIGTLDVNQEGLEDMHILGDAFM